MTALRFNITRQTEFKVYKDNVQIFFQHGRWITIKPDVEDPEPETPEQIIQSLIERLGSEETMSLWIPLDLITYDTTGRCQMMQFNMQHRDVNFETAVETWHCPCPAFPESA